MKKTYHVQLEPSTVWAKDIKIEAESMDEAVKIAREKHCDKAQVEVSYTPTWIQPKPEDAEEGYEDVLEYFHRVHGECDDCGITLFEGDASVRENDWPWEYAAGDTRHHTYICYPCAMKRKEAKNYCPFFKNFFRSYKEGCDSCPDSGCKTLRERMIQRLRKALSFSNASPTAVNHFLDNCQIRLAYDTLRESGSRYEEDFESHMQAVKENLDEGWLD